MLVQLQNGKTVYMSLEQYLAMEESDFQYLVSVNYGSVASSPWCGSALKKPGRIRTKDEDDDPDDLEGIPEEELDLDDDLPDPLINDVNTESDIPDSE